PSRAGSMHVRTLGRPSTSMRQLGQSPETHSRPRGLWYLKLRVKTRTPAAYRAAAMLWPATAGVGGPSDRRRDGGGGAGGETGGGKGGGGADGAAWSSRPVRSTSLVRTSRSAVSQRRQPRRWYQRSRCGPGRLLPDGAGRIWPP